MNDSKNNERKLIKNIDNIIHHYMKIDEKLLESIALKDDVAFKERAGDVSTDHFLTGIMDTYDDFAEQLKERITELKSSEIEQIEKKKMKEEKVRKEKKKKTITPIGRQRQKPGLKGKKQKWSRKEEQIIKRSIRTGKKPADIRIKINAERQKEGLPLRSYSSVSSKTSRTKNKMELK